MKSLKQTIAESLNNVNEARVRPNLHTREDELDYADDINDILDVFDLQLLSATIASMQEIKSYNADDDYEYYDEVAGNYLHTPTGKTFNMRLKWSSTGEEYSTDFPEHGQVDDYYFNIHEVSISSTDININPKAERLISALNAKESRIEKSWTRNVSTQTGLHPLYEALMLFNNLHAQQLGGLYVKKK